MKKFLLGCLASLLLSGSAFAVPVCDRVTPINCFQPDVDNIKTNITTNTTTNISGAKFLQSITLNTAVASATIKLYDGVTAVNIFATITEPSTITSIDPVTLVYDIPLTTGLTIVTSGATDITVTTR